MEKQNIYLSSAHMRCKPNAVLTSSIARFVKENGHNIVRDFSSADYVLLNTCAFTADQEQVCVDFFREAKVKSGNQTKFVSMGCMNKIAGESYSRAGLDDVIVLNEDEEIDSYLARIKNYNDVKGEFVDDALLGEMGIDIYPTSSLYSRGVKRFVYGLEKLRGKNITLGLLFRTIEQTNKVFIEVAKGCVGNCAYCIIKKAKGHVKSRPKDEILDDVRELYSPDKTIYLVGDDCASYGVDNSSSISDLILYIHEHFPDAAFNINYVSPFWLEKQEEEFASLFERVNIASLNITMQSGSDHIIKKMNRSYKSGNIKRIVKRLRKISPDTVFLTHVLVGFPGEGIGDYFKTLNLMRYFDASSVFAYCDREGTKSDKMNDKVSGTQVKFRALFANLYFPLLILIRSFKDIIKGR